MLIEMILGYKQCVELIFLWYKKWVSTYNVFQIRVWINKKYLSTIQYHFYFSGILQLMGWSSLSEVRWGWCREKHKCIQIAKLQCKQQIRSYIVSLNNNKSEKILLIAILLLLKENDFTRNASFISVKSEKPALFNANI